jgi:hypothetical protein
MPYKFDSNGSLVLADVNGAKLPVFVHADGKEAPFDADSTLGTISRLNGEAKSHRERAEAAEKLLKGFEGISDPQAALKALGIVKNLDDKKLVDAGQVEQMRSEAIRAVEEKYAPVVKQVQTLEQQLHSEKIGGAFARSKFIAEKVAIPADMVMAAFGPRFKLEDGQVVAYGTDGNKVYSRSSPGNPAGFDEALELLIEQYPNRAAILKGSNASGSGASPSNGGGGGGKRTMTRAQFDSLSPMEKATTAKEAAAGKVVISD